jgi:hypothetical protein
MPSFIKIETRVFELSFGNQVTEGEAHHQIFQTCSVPYSKVTCQFEIILIKPREKSLKSVISDMGIISIK